jgi:hypothetical protein
LARSFIDETLPDPGAAKNAGIEGKTLAGISGGRQMYKFVVGPAGAQRAVRKYMRFIFRSGIRGTE